MTTERLTSKKWRPQLRPQDARVGKHFVLSDFLYNEVAITEGIPNVPESLSDLNPHLAGMRGLCRNILDPVVDQFGPVSITFAYVSPKLNARRGGNGGDRGLHLYRPPSGGIGGAADIVIHAHPDPRPVLFWIKDNCEFDRIILYPGSRILCLAWTSVKRRSHCKEWVFVEGQKKPVYRNASRMTPAEDSGSPTGQKRVLQLDLSDRLDQLDG